MLLQELLEDPGGDKKSAASEFDRGKALLSSRHWGAAVEAFRAAVKLDPESNCAWFALGYASGEGRAATGTDEEIAAYQQAVRIDPKDASAYTNLGILYATQQKDFPGAEAAFRTAIAAAPTLASAHYNLGNLLEDQHRDYPGAEAAYRSAIAAVPTHASAHFNLGNLLEHHSNDPSGAEAEFRAVLAIRPGDRVARYKIAVAEGRRLDAVGNLGAAAGAWYFKMCGTTLSAIANRGKYSIRVPPMSMGAAQ
jgi:tetratricopeptide (TPR) repeat protein